MSSYAATGETRIQSRSGLAVVTAKQWMAFAFTLTSGASIGFGIATRNENVGLVFVLGTAYVLGLATVQNIVLPYLSYLGSWLLSGTDRERAWRDSFPWNRKATAGQMFRLWAPAAVGVFLSCFFFGSSQASRIWVKDDANTASGGMMIALPIGMESVLRTERVRYEYAASRTKDGIPVQVIVIGEVSAIPDALPSLVARHRGDLAGAYDHERWVMFQSAAAEAVRGRTLDEIGRDRLGMERDVLRRAQSDYAAPAGPVDVYVRVMPPP